MAGGNVSNALGPLFVAAGQRFGIPPQVLAGVASVETGLGSDRSTSSAGAVGLMQFEPGTAAGLHINPLNDRQAVFGAAKLLTQFGYHSNPLRALGSYNGGPGNPQYGYARLVMSEANRLKPQVARFSGGQAPAAMGQDVSKTPGGKGLTVTPTSFKQVTTQGFDQAAFDAAKAKSIAGSYIADTRANNPYAIGPKIPGFSQGEASNPLFTTGALTTAPPNPADYQTAQTNLQKIAGKSVTLNQHPAAFQAGISSSGGKYVNPLPGANWERTDEGVDASLPNGAPIRAIGDSKVVGITQGWYKGQPLITFRFLNGPQAGKLYYIAEAINPRVKPGDTVRAGQVVGTYNINGTGLELGWASGGTAAAHGHYVEGQYTPEGTNFRNFLNGIGAKAGPDRH